MSSVDAGSVTVARGHATKNLASISPFFEVADADGYVLAFFRLRNP